ncbi:hypothetical protein FOYG_12652 [Fusarium oxysporum NRRL 32931]|uniref:Uncharacterized protein n=1 Tax=Fusarium oxysporum NRRL 32931 TaxID=660029 RepID=W9HWY7_FUSOX|nr:hypothetical protein FOYG_12652 [Fusarium oxysporum NRRL 32931]
MFNSQVLCCTLDNWPAAIEKILSLSNSFVTLFVSYTSFLSQVQLLNVSAQSSPSRRPHKIILPTYHKHPRKYTSPTATPPINPKNKHHDRQPNPQPSLSPTRCGVPHAF